MTLDNLVDNTVKEIGLAEANAGQAISVLFSAQQKFGSGKLSKEDRNAILNDIKNVLFNQSKNYGIPVESADPQIQNQVLMSLLGITPEAIIPDQLNGETILGIGKQVMDFYKKPIATRIGQIDESILKDLPKTPTQEDAIKYIMTQALQKYAGQNN